MFSDFINYIFGDNDRAQTQNRWWIVVRGMLLIVLLVAVGCAFLGWMMDDSP